MAENIIMGPWIYINPLDDSAEFHVQSHESREADSTWNSRRSFNEFSLDRLAFINKNPE